MKSPDIGNFYRNVATRAAGAVLLGATTMMGPSPSHETPTAHAQSDSNSSSSDLVGSDLNKVRPPSEESGGMTDKQIDEWFAAQGPRPLDWEIVDGAQDYDDQTKITPLAPTTNTPTK